MLTTTKLSLCCQNEFLLTLLLVSPIVEASGKKWVEVGAYPREALLREGQCFEASRTLRWTTKVGWPSPPGIAALSWPRATAALS